MILNNCRLISDLSGGIQTEKGSVVVRDGKIEAVYPHPVDIKTDEEIYECEGKTLLPGLIDMHTHIVMLNDVGREEAGEPMKLAGVAALQAKKYLDYGFTTIRDCGSIYRAAVYVRDMIKSGLFDGPDILACGETLYPSSVVNTDSERGRHKVCVDGAAGFQRKTRIEAVHGADFIKIYASGSAFGAKGAPLHALMTEEEIRAAVETAEMSGLYVAAHCHADRAVRACIENGVKTIEHATYMSSETIKLLLDTPECSLIPTLSAMYVSQTEPKARARWLSILTPMLENTGRAAGEAFAAGVKMGFGTDSTPGSPMYEKGIEFTFRKKYCGMRDLDILLQATKINAQIAGYSHEKGELKAGLFADMILVNGRPDEDISVMGTRPERVWKRGKPVR